VADIVKETSNLHKEVGEVRQTVAIVVGIVLALVALGTATTFGGFVGFAAGAALAGIGPPGERHIAGEGPDKIALIRVTGPITRDGEAGLFGPAASSRRIIELLDRAERDAAVRAVILELNTPGGSVVASAEIHARVLALRQAGKPVIVRMTETAASGGYYIASAASHIVADPSTITGSIGVIVVLANIEEFNRKIGIRTIVFRSGRFKDIGNPNRPVTPEETVIIRGLVDEIHQRFVDVVAQGRRMDRPRVLRVADGRIFTGREALRLGLVDSLGQFPETVAVALRLANLERARIVEYPTDGLLQALVGFATWPLRPIAGQQGSAAAFSLQYLMVP
jgi:protease-4